MRRHKPSGASTMLWRVAAFATPALAVLALAGTAAAESCLNEVLGIAVRYRVATDPPTVAPGGNPDVTTRDLARSGGVIEPPRVQDKSVIQPSPGQHYAMPTIPDVTPKQDLAAADRTTLQAVLVAARAQAERGNEAGCREGLAKARKILERTD